MRAVVVGKEKVTVTEVTVLPPGRTAGLKVAVTPGGSPEALKVTASGKVCPVAFRLRWLQQWYRPLSASR